MAKLTVKLGDDSGLPELADRAQCDPSRSHLAIVAANAVEIREQLATGQKTVTIQITKIEEVAPGDMLDALRMMQRAKDCRSPQQALDFSDGSKHPDPVFPSGTVVDVNSGEIIPPKPVPLGGETVAALAPGEVALADVVVLKPDSAVPATASRADWVDDNLDLVVKAGRLVIDSGIGSTAMLQRKLSIGFRKASALMDRLSDLGVVGPVKGGLPREVMMDRMSFDRLCAEEIDDREPTSTGGAPKVVADQEDIRDL